MKELPLNALRVLALAHRERGVRAAARSLGVSHSAVSRHLKLLESWAGVPLMEPDGGSANLLLTAQGEALATTVFKALSDIDNAAAALREARGVGSVVVATTPSFAVRWLFPRLNDLAQRCPHVELSVTAEQRVGDMGDGRADFALRMGRGGWSDGKSWPLMSDALYPVIGGALIDSAHVRPWTLDTLARQRLLHDRDPQAGWDVWRRAHGPKQLNLARGPRLTSSDLVLRAAVLGQGVALARHRLASNDVKTGLLARPFGDLQVALPDAYWLVTPLRGRPRRAVHDVIDWLRACAAVEDG